jgi:hypothetical protein
VDDRIKGVDEVEVEGPRANEEELERAAIRRISEPLSWDDLFDQIDTGWFGNKGDRPEQ